MAVQKQAPEDRMSDIQRMREVESKMRISTLPIAQIPSGSGWAYWLDGRAVSTQIVTDMVADGWLKPGRAMNGCRRSTWSSTSIADA
jgi:hypothetical protein